MSDLRDQALRDTRTMVQDLRAQLATAEAALNEKDVALRGLIEHIERLFGDTTHPAMATRALLAHARAAAQDGKP